MRASGAPPLTPTRPQVVGKPIAVDKVEEASEEQVEELHARFLADLRKLFDDNKERVGYGHKTLVVD